LPHLRSRSPPPSDTRPSAQRARLRAQGRI
jgi:hypothetical protein